MLRTFLAVGAFCALALAGVAFAASPPVDVQYLEPVPAVTAVVYEAVMAEPVAFTAAVAMFVIAIIGAVLTVTRQRSGRGAANDLSRSASYRPRRFRFDPGRMPA